MAGNAQIPIIDISATQGDQGDIAKHLVAAAAEHGFIYIKNTGRDISAEKIQKAFELSKLLFESPLEEKQRCSIQQNNQGWSGMHSETLDPASQRVGDFKEAFNFGPFKDGRATQPVPASMEAHHAELASFRDACHELCRKLLFLFGVGLEVSPADFFTAAHNPDEPSGSILRFLRYPPPSETPDAQAGDVRAGAHSDYGSVTLLFRIPGQAGLEILTPSNTWAPVPVTPPGTENDPSPPILVNIGDLLSYWTNGLLRSTVHRVSFSPGQAAHGESSVDPRYSLVFFCHPAHDTPLVSVPSERVRNFSGVSSQAKEGNPYAERKVLTAEEHLQMRLQASYGDLYKDKSKGA
ncbi:uncharacterized protein B0I36DRAFT_320061 [Microdochium trichocladiopsis]|uniref:Fe2OG dioxygenase domain-containing protein n=1 Tax=Microdochium trichocladiopsis TaxID=1682393 RepID=A0A9P8YAZ5_9PEZI|nr:uncharacterized protein B0I36DRAFT_320061 [Microdochium trichocladiopsis]KAH7032798.1 hypothetical protein B0I36DRAFT_320061 [Microdochium trichocladiopsis]